MITATTTTSSAAPTGTPITSCSTGAIQSALASGGSWVLKCSGDIAVPGAPFLVSKSVAIAADTGAKVTFDGLGKFTVFDVGAGGRVATVGAERLSVRDRHAG
jgi:hypothetical protein